MITRNENDKSKKSQNDLEDEYSRERRVHARSQGVGGSSLRASPSPRGETHRAMIHWASTSDLSGVGLRSLISSNYRMIFVPVDW